VRVCVAIIRERAGLDVLVILDLFSEVPSVRDARREMLDDATSKPPPVFAIAPSDQGLTYLSQARFPISLSIFKAGSINNQWCRPRRRTA